MKLVALAGWLAVATGRDASAADPGWRDFPVAPAFEAPAGVDLEPVVLRWAGGWVLAKVEVNGVEAGWFKIATGWKFSMIDREVAVRLGLPALPESGLLTRTDTQGGGARLVRVDRLALGGAAAAGVALECADLSELSREVEKMYGEGIAGVLGWDLLGTLPFSLDEPRLRMTWQRKAEPPEGAVRLDLTEKGRCPFVDVTLGDSCATPAMVNSAAVSVALQRPFLAGHAEALWTGPLIATGSGYHGLPGDDDNLPLGDAAKSMRNSRWIEVGIGGEKEQQPAAVSPRTNPEMGDVQVGYGMFRKRVVVIDGPGKALWLAASDTVPEVAVAEMEKPPAYLLTVALQSAVDFNDPKAVKALAKAGADVKGQPRQEPLPRACAMGARAAAEALAKAGAPVEPGPEQQALPLIAACESGDVKLVRFLLDKGADPARGNLSRLTPLLVAARNGNPEVIEAVRDKTGLPEDPVQAVGLLGESGAGGNLKFAKELLEKIPKEKQADLEWPVLLERVVLLGEPEAAAWVLETAGGEIATEPSQLPPLIAAILPTRIGKTDGVREKLVEILLEAGADPNAACKGTTPLLLAARHGNAAIIRMLLDAGAKPDATDAKQRTTLLRAAAANLPAEVVAALLHPKVDKNAVDSGAEMTALALYAARGNAGACKILLDAGAAVDEASLFGSTPLVAAANGKQAAAADALAVVELLLSHGAKAQPPDGPDAAPGALFGAVVSDRAGLIGPLVRAGARVEHKAGGVTPLAWACAMAGPETVRALLDCKADASAADRSGVSAMGHAAAAGKVGNLRVLLERGVPPDARGAGEVPPVWLAAAAGHSRAVRLLLAAGAAADVRHPVRETTAIDAVRARGDREMVRILETGGK